MEKKEGWDPQVPGLLARVAIHMGVKETGMQTGNRGEYNWPLSQE